MKFKTYSFAFLAMAMMLSAWSAMGDNRTLKLQAPLAARTRMLNRLPATNRLELAIGLPLRNQQAMTNLLHQMYDTRSTNFHRCFTPEQFAAQFGPTVEDYEKVKAFARSNHLTILREFGNRALVHVAGNVSDIESIFHVHLGTFQHPTENRQFLAPDVEPTVDTGMPVLYVAGLDDYLIPKPRGHRVPLDKTLKERPAGGSGSSGKYIGDDYRNVYLPGTSLTGSGQVIGLFELDGYTPSDITLYESLAGRNNIPLHNILNRLAPGSGNDEVAIDIESCIAMAPGLDGINVYEAPNNGMTDSLIINEMVSPTEGERLPLEISSSWGFAGDTDVEQGLIELAMQGQSFFYALGDNGAFQNGVDTNTDQDLIYMVAVGGTQLFMTNNGTSWVSETEWHDNPGTNFAFFAGAGGVLTQVPIPDYQKPVSMALNQGSTQFRNTPDVALVARDIEGVSTGTNDQGKFVKTNQVLFFVGTSISAPLWAGIAALINQQGVQQGLPPIGFLLPAIYNIGESPAYTDCFHDITVGNNAWSDPATGTSSDNLYSAANGYDLCTGWGTPNGVTLINTLLNFAGPIFVDFNYTGSTKNGTYAFPYKTLAEGTNAVSPGGTIIFKSAGSSSETMTIKKPMTLNANDGPATIGH